MLTGAAAKAVMELSQERLSDPYPYQYPAPVPVPMVPRPPEPEPGSLNLRLGRRLHYLILSLNNSSLGAGIYRI